MKKRMPKPKVELTGESCVAGDLVVRSSEFPNNTLWVMVYRKKYAQKWIKIMSNKWSFWE